MAHFDQAVQGASAGGPSHADPQSKVLVHVAEQVLGQSTLGLESFHTGPLRLTQQAVIPAPLLPRTGPAPIKAILLPSLAAPFQRGSSFQAACDGPAASSAEGWPWSGPWQGTLPRQNS